MAKIELKGTITGVGVVQQVGKNNMPKQVIILSVPAFTDEFGEKRGEDQNWCLEIIGDNVANLNLQVTDVDRKVTCTVFVESRFVTLPDVGQQKGQQFYQISAKLWKTAFKV